MEMPLDQMPLTSRKEVQAAMEKEKKDAAEKEAELLKVILVKIVLKFLFSIFIKSCSVRLTLPFS